MAKNRVVIITGVFLPEPVVSASLMSDLAERLSGKYDVTVLRPHPTRPKGFKVPAYDLSDKPYDVVELDSFTCPESSIIGRFRESYSMGKACQKYIDAHKDEIKLVYNGPWHVFGRDIVRKVCNKYAIPYITPVQDVYPESLLSKLPKISIVQSVVRGILKPYDDKLLQQAKLVHTISNGMRDYLSDTRKVSRENFVVVRNWQNEQDFVDYRNCWRDEVKKEPFTFMYMGNIGPVAGVDLLLEAFETAGLKDARLVIAGSGSAKSALQEQARHMDANIEFWDVPYGQVPATQDKADVMCLPIKKGFASTSIPSKLPAYMFSAKPIICCADLDSDTVACINEAKAGWTLEPEDVSLLAQKFAEVYNVSKERLENMGMNGFNYGIANFSRGMNLSKLAEACIRIAEKQ